MSKICLLKTYGFFCLKKIANFVSNASLVYMYKYNILFSATDFETHNDLASNAFQRAFLPKVMSTVLSIGTYTGKYRHA